MDIIETCDKILQFCLTNNNCFREHGEKEKKQLPNFRQNHDALSKMLNESPPLVNKIQEYEYYLTSDGEIFAKKGGYKSKRKQEQTEQITFEQDRILTRLVNQSVLDTNMSLIDMNKKTENIYNFQKKTTGLTLFVASCAVIISLISLFKDESTIDMQPIWKQIDKKQIEINKLRESLMNISCRDSLRKKHP
jgi:hypothetical protein